MNNFIQIDAPVSFGSSFSADGSIITILKTKYQATINDNDDIGYCFITYSPPDPRFNAPLIPNIINIEVAMREGATHPMRLRPAFQNRGPGVRGGWARIIITSLVGWLNSNKPDGLNDDTKLYIPSDSSGNEKGDSFWRYIGFIDNPEIENPNDPSRGYELVITWKTLFDWCAKESVNAQLARESITINAGTGWSGGGRKSRKTKKKIRTKKNKKMKGGFNSEHPDVLTFVYQSHGNRMSDEHIAATQQVLQAKEAAETPGSQNVAALQQRYRQLLEYYDARYSGVLTQLIRDNRLIMAPVGGVNQHGGPELYPCMIVPDNVNVFRGGTDGLYTWAGRGVDTNFASPGNMHLSCNIANIESATGPGIKPGGYLPIYLLSPGKEGETHIFGGLYTCNSGQENKLPGMLTTPDLINCIVNNFWIQKAFPGSHQLVPSHKLVEGMDDRVYHNRRKNLVLWSCNPGPLPGLGQQVLWAIYPRGMPGVKFVEGQDPKITGVGTPNSMSVGFRAKSLMDSIVGQAAEQPNPEGEFHIGAFEVDDPGAAGAMQRHLDEEFQQEMHRRNINTDMLIQQLYSTGVDLAAFANAAPAEKLAWLATQGGGGARKRKKKRKTRRKRKSNK